MDEKEIIMVVEDSESMNNFIAKNLVEQGFEVIQCFNAKDAYRKFSKNFISLVILDLNLGDDIGGMRVLHSIRLQDKILPVMIVSSINTDKSKIEGFREGCDDYITKPFYIEELILRIKRMLEKSLLIGFNKNTLETLYTNGIFELDLDSLTVCKNGKKIPMRKKQFDMMLYFIRNSNKILPFEAIYQNVWNEPIPDEKTLESNIYVNIRSLRNLIEDDKKNPRHIVSVSKCGYIFVPE